MTINYIRSTVYKGPHRIRVIARGIIGSIPSREEGVLLTEEQKRSLQQRWYPELWDDAGRPIQDALDEKLASGEAVVLDAGCSEGTWLLRPHRGTANLLIGADLSAAATPGFPFAVSDICHAPFRASTFDIIVCHNVLEHLRQPKNALVEFARVLKPGGNLFFQTPSVQAPLMKVARWMPHFVRRRLKKAVTGVDIDDILPVIYYCNTPRRLDRCLHSVGLKREMLHVWDEMHEYLAFSSWSYAFGLWYSRFIRRGPLRALGTTMAGVYTKPLV